MSIRARLARLLCPQEFEDIAEREKNIDLEVNNRVADVLFKMDPFEPLLKKYNIIFSREWEHPEDRLDDPSRHRLFMWAYGVEHDMSFRYLRDWIMNTQGNATVRKASVDEQWFFGRAMIASMALFEEEIRRLSSHYKEMVESRNAVFEEHLTVE